MRLAFLSDVHSNLEALQAVIADIEKRQVAKVFFLGDAVGYGVNPNECVKLIRSTCEVRLLGNHDYVAMGLEDPEYFNHSARESIAWTQNKLNKKTIKILADFDMDSVFLDYYMVHATPLDPMEWNYILNVSDTVEQFEGFSQTFCLIGHSHLPAIYRRQPDGKITLIEEPKYTAEDNCRYIINVGSVGQPRDGNPAACYLVVETADNSFEYCRVGYDIEAVQKKMARAQLPEMLINRLADGR